MEFLDLQAWPQALILAPRLAHFVVSNLTGPFSQAPSSIPLLLSDKKMSGAVCPHTGVFGLCVFLGHLLLGVMKEQQLTLTLSQATPCCEGPRPSHSHRPPPLKPGQGYRPRAEKLLVLRRTLTTRLFSDFFPLWAYRCLFVIGRVNVRFSILAPAVTSGPKGGGVRLIVCSQRASVLALRS